MASFLGIDVGGKRKGFHLAEISSGEPVGDPLQLADVAAVVEQVEQVRPAMIGLDSPKSCADPGESSRRDEREFRSAGICAIRWTPDEATVRSGGAYFEWVRNGLDLYEALAKLIDPELLIEVFPTAAWTQLHAPRGNRSRSEWSIEALESLDLDLAATRRWSQDDRDAVAAAYTAMLFAEHPERTLRFGDLVVPAPSRG